jgi:hypothetical protein
MDEQDKLHLLASLAHDLNAQGITWSLGASCFLYLKGIAPTFHDLDFMVAYPDVEKAEAVFAHRGVKQPDHYDYSKFGTKVFAEYEVAGVDVDLMADFSIIKDGKEYKFPLEETSIVERYSLEGETIPFESLEIWRERYALMGRSEKVRMIESYLKH